MTTKYNIYGLNTLTLLGLLLVGLKLSDIIDWSWRWVLTPFWAPIAIGVTVLLTLLLIIGILKGVRACLK